MNLTVRQRLLDGLLVHPEEKKSFLIALAIVALARAQAAVDITYASDDYRQIINGLGSIAHALVADQGRVGEYVLFKVFDFFGFDPGRSPIISLLLSVVLAVWVGNGALRILAPNLPHWPRALIISIIAAHPYTIEILTFRGIFIYHIISYAVAIYAILIARMHVLWIVAASFIFSIALTIYQIPLSLVSTLLVVELSLSMIRWCLGSDRIIDRNYYARILTCVFGLLLYLVWLRLTSGNGGGHPRSSIVDISEIPGRIWLGINLLYGHMVDGSVFWVPVVPIPIMLLPAIFLCVAIIELIIKLKARAAMPVLVIIATPIIGGLAMLGMPLLTKLLFIPTRVIPHISLLWAWSALILWAVMRGRLPRDLFTSLLILIVFIFVVQDNQLFTDQSRMVVRDHYLALRVYDRIEQINPKPERVIFVRGQTPPTGMVDTTNYGLNDSVLLYPWSAPYMLTELTGTPFSPATAQEEIEARAHCGETPRWPAQDSVTIRGYLAIVCL